MSVSVTYSCPKIADARGYFNLKPTASYARIKIAAAYQDFGIVTPPPATLVLGESPAFSDSGYVAGQDYIAATFFLTGDYVADYYRPF